MSSTLAGFITLLVPIFGLFIGRLMVGDLTTYAWTYIPIFWGPPLSLVPAILIWMGKIGKQPTPASTPTPTSASTPAPPSTTNESFRSSRIVRY